MATITREITRLEAATAAERQARAELTALRERQLAEGNVTPEEFGDAGDALALAELDREGAEQAEAEAATVARLAALRALREEIEAPAAPGPVTAAAEQVMAGVAALVTALGPQRSHRIARQLAALRRLNVKETAATGSLRPRTPDSDGTRRA